MSGGGGCGHGGPAFGTTKNRSVAQREWDVRSDPPETQGQGKGPVDTSGVTHFFELCGGKPPSLWATNVVEASGLPSVHWVAGLCRQDSRDRTNVLLIFFGNFLVPSHRGRHPTGLEVVRSEVAAYGRQSSECRWYRPHCAPSVFRLKILTIFSGNTSATHKLFGSSGCAPSHHPFDVAAQPQEPRASTRGAGKT